MKSTKKVKFFFIIKKRFTCTFILDLYEQTIFVKAAKIVAVSIRLLSNIVWYTDL